MSLNADMKLAPSCEIGGGPAKARGGRVLRSGVAVSAERVDCLAVLELAAASPNSLRSLRSLCSDSGDENVDERASRLAASPVLLSATQARRTRPPRAFASETPVCSSLEEKPGLSHTMNPASRPVGPGAGDLWNAEERSVRGGARSALRNLTHRACLNAAPAGRVVSCAMRPTREHRRAVRAFSAGPFHHEPAPGPTGRDACDRQRKNNEETQQDKK